MSALVCRVHGTALVEKEVPVLFGMPTQEDTEIYARFPHHGLVSLGGCEVSTDEPEEYC